MDQATALSAADREGNDTCNRSSPTKQRTIDSVITDYSPFSYEQKRTLIIAAISVLFVSPQAGLMVFVTPLPEWTCQRPPTDKYTEPTAAVGLLVASEKERCALLERGQCSPNYSNPSGTASAEFGLICADSGRVTYAQSLFFTGMLLGGALCGRLSDGYGRRFAIITAAVLVATGSLMTTVAGSFWSLALARCLAGAGVMICVIAVSVLFNESVATSLRGPLAPLSGVNFGLGMAAVAPLAYTTRHSWRLLVAVCTIISLVNVVMVWRYVSESPHWLHGNGEHSRLQQLLMTWSQSNATPIPSSVFNSLTSTKKKHARCLTSAVSSNRQESISLLPFLSKNFRYLTVTLLWAWFTVCLVFYGLSFNMNGVGSSVYVSFFIISVMDFPAKLSGAWMLQYWGRKPLLFRLMLSTAIFTAMSAVMAKLKTSNTSQGLLQLISSAQLLLAVSGKVCSSVVFSLVYLYTSELVPTAVRTGALGVCGVVSRLGAVVCPFIIRLGYTDQAIPSIVFSICAFLSAMSMTRWPETKDKELPETLQDLQQRIRKK